MKIQISKILFLVLGSLVLIFVMGKEIEAKKYLKIPFVPVQTKS